MTTLARPTTAEERERARRLRERMNAPEEEYAPADRARRPSSGDVTAAAEVHTGAMVALVPTAADAARLAVDGAEPAEQLHVTLGYLGEAALIPSEVQRGVLEAVGYCVADRVSIVGNAFAVAMFNPDTDGDVVAGGREPCVVLLLSGSQLAPLQEYVMRDVGRVFAAAGVQLHPQHSPWVAHLTLAYTADADLAYFTDRVGPVTFDRVRVAFGDEVVDLPLGSLVAASEE